jgi:hypothetical protein
VSSEYPLHRNAGRAPRCSSVSNRADRGGDRGSSGLLTGRRSIFVSRIPGVPGSSRRHEAPAAEWYRPGHLEIAEIARQACSLFIHGFAQPPR